MKPDQDADNLHYGAGSAALDIGIVPGLIIIDDIDTLRKLIEAYRASYNLFCMSICGGSGVI